MAVTVLSTRGGYQPTFPLSPDQLDQMQRLWEGMPELSAAAIGRMFGVPKNVVIGHRWRKGWKSRKPATKEPTTIFTRANELHAALDQVLAETRPYVEDRKKTVIEVERVEEAA